MFNILSVIKGLVSLSNILAKYAHDKQLLDAGEYKAIAEMNNAQIKKINKVINARRSVKHDNDSVRNDKDNRDIH